MTKSDQIKILNNKIRANNIQYNLDEHNAEISAYSSSDLDKYEYLTDKGLGYKPDALQQARFEYSPLGRIFNAGLDKKGKKVGILQGKNIEESIKPKNKPQTNDEEDVEDEILEKEPEELPIIRNGILNEYNLNNLISRSRIVNPDMPKVINGKKGYNAYVDLKLNKISQDQYDEIFNAFNNDVDRIIRVRGNNLGPT